MAEFSTNKMAVKSFIEEIAEFTKDYKRKPKHVRRASGNDEGLIMLKKSVPTEKKCLK